jgi:hypothetical protein
MTCTHAIPVFSSERVLENSGDSVAPPPRPRPTANVSLLPDKPVLVNRVRARRALDEHDAAASDDHGNSSDEVQDTKAKKGVHRAGGHDTHHADPADITADESGTGEEDRRTPSPGLQGASRTEGGHFRGRASGNAPAFGDTTQDTGLDLVSPLMGHVVLYNSQAVNGAPLFFVSQPVAPNLKSILPALSSKYSPIRSMSSVVCIVRC